MNASANDYVNRKDIDSHGSQALSLFYIPQWKHCGDQTDDYPLEQQCLPFVTGNKTLWPRQQWPDNSNYDEKNRPDSAVCVRSLTNQSENQLVLMHTLKLTYSHNLCCRDCHNNEAHSLPDARASKSSSPSLGYPDAPYFPDHSVPEVTRESNVGIVRQRVPLECEQCPKR